MASQSSSSTDSILSRLAGASSRSIVIPSTDARAAAETSAAQAAARVTASAAGIASSSAQGVRDVFQGALDELHNQEEQAATWLRWGTVAFGLLVLLLVVAIGAWFFAPARALVGAVT